MAVVIPRKIINATAREVFIANSRPLYALSSSETHILKLRPDSVSTSTSDTRKLITFDEITKSVIAEALAKCYIYDIEVEPTYRVKIELRGMDPEHPMKTVVEHSIWIGRDCHQAWIAIGDADAPAKVRFDLNKIDS